MRSKILIPRKRAINQNCKVKILFVCFLYSHSWLFEFTNSIWRKRYLLKSLFETVWKVRDNNSFCIFRGFLPLPPPNFDCTNPKFKTFCSLNILWWLFIATCFADGYCYFSWKRWQTTLYYETFRVNVKIELVERTFQNLLSGKKQ